MNGKAAFLLAGFGLAGTSIFADEPQAIVPEKHLDLLFNHCMDCHNSDTRKGKVNLEDLPLEVNTLQHAELWQKVLDVLNSGEMPPENKRQPESVAKADFLGDLANTMVLARKILSDSGGQITMRRLNRREYQNTMKYLTGVSLNVDSLPSDGGSGTFDTVGASQYISSDQFEQYLELGRTAVDEAFERLKVTAKDSFIFRVEPEKTINEREKKSLIRFEESAKRFYAWKAKVDQVARAPENHEYMENFRKEYPTFKLNAPRSHKFYFSAGQLIGAPDARNFGFKDDFDATFTFQSGYDRLHAYISHYHSLPKGNQGSYLKLGWGIQRVDILPPKHKIVPGSYRIRIRAGAVEESPFSRRFIDIGHPQRINQVAEGFSGLPISTHQVTGTVEYPEIIETYIEVGKDTPREFAIREKQHSSEEEARREFFVHRRENGYGTPAAVWVDWIELEGPIQKKQAAKLEITRVEPEKTINPANEEYIKQVEAHQERFRQWKKGVDEAAKSPENQAIIAEIRKKDRLIDHPNRFYTFAEHFKGAPDSRDFGFIDCHKAAAADPSRSKNLALHKHYVSLPHRDTGTYLKLTQGTGRVIVPQNKKDLQPGNYVVRVRVGAVKGTPASRRFIEVGHPQRDIDSRDWGLKGKPIGVRQVTGTIEAPQIIEFPIELRPGMPKEFAVQEKQSNTGNLKVLWDDHKKLRAENGYGHPPAIWIDWVELEGPLAPPENKIFKQRREVEHYATTKVKKKYENYFKAGYEAALAFQKDGIPRPKVGVKDLDEAKFRIRRYEMEAPSQLRYLNDPLTKTGSLLGVFDRNGNLNSEEFIEISMDPLGIKKKSKPLPMGKYKIRVRMGSVEGTSSDRHFAVLGSVSNGGSRNVDGDGFSLLETFQVTGTTTDPQVFETTVELTLNGTRKFALREKSNLKADTLMGKNEIYRGGMASPPALWIDWVEWEGPLHDKAQDGGLVPILQNNLSGSLDTEEKRARSIFQRFCVEAFRQVDPDPMFIDQLVGLYKRRMTAGDSFDVAIRTPLSVILASPGFLYLDEPNIDGPKRPLNDRELAVRLAYFLWSGPPDAKLYDLAEKGLLKKSWILNKQVERMIADPRSEEFVAGFVHQWLHMERLDFFQFDTKLHREFDESVRASARKEVYESFALLLRDQEGGHLGKLLKSDYVMINGLLGTYYGIEGVSGDHFRKVSLPPGSPRGGLLGTAAVLAMGSDGIESSPVERGAWVLRYLLNDPPPPAPPNVPQLSRLADKPLTARERVLAHQEEPQCASCHRKIDPIGFGLENFTAAGKWRSQNTQLVKNGKKTTKRNYDIDPSGKFHKGPGFADYFEMRDLIAQREDDFARGFTEHLIGYGLGRPFGFTDEDLANEITSAAKKEDHSVSAFVHALVQSKAFITK